MKNRRSSAPIPLLPLPSFERVLATLLSDVVLPETSVLASVAALEIVVPEAPDLRDELTDSEDRAGVLPFIKRWSCEVIWVATGELGFLGGMAAGTTSCWSDPRTSSTWSLVGGAGAGPRGSDSRRGYEAREEGR